jgi:hypothetical protein
MDFNEERRKIEEAETARQQLQQEDEEMQDEDEY